METKESDIGTLHVPLNSKLTQLKEVPVKHICLDRWEAYYEGKWRMVHITEKRTYIKNRDQKLDIEIFGV